MDVPGTILTINNAYFSNASGPTLALALALALAPAPVHHFYRSQSAKAHGEKMAELGSLTF